MLKRISHIKGMGVFQDFDGSEESGIPEFKNFNLFYGWNYAGKTTISRIFQFISPFVFLLFASKKVTNTKRIIHSSIFIALINIPLSIYEIIVQPVWGVVTDWRGIRIFGNLFWHGKCC